MCADESVAVAQVRNGPDTKELLFSNWSWSLREFTENESGGTIRALTVQDAKDVYDRLFAKDCELPIQLQFQVQHPGLLKVDFFGDDQDERQMLFDPAQGWSLVEHLSEESGWDGLTPTDFLETWLFRNQVGYLLIKELWHAVGGLLWRTARTLCQTEAADWFIDHERPLPPDLHNKSSIPLLCPGDSKGSEDVLPESEVADAPEAGAQTSQQKIDRLVAEAKSQLSDRQNVIFDCMRSNATEGTFDELANLASAFDDTPAKDSAILRQLKGSNENGKKVGIRNKLEKKHWGFEVRASDRKYRWTKRPDRNC